MYDDASALRYDKQNKLDVLKILNENSLFSTSLAMCDNDDTNFASICEDDRWTDNCSLFESTYIDKKSLGHENRNKKSNPNHKDSSVLSNTALDHSENPFSLPIVGSQRPK